jgi:hypothetical protein
MIYDGIHLTNVDVVEGAEKSLAKMNDPPSVVNGNLEG